uniref:Inositol hexakisphosphate and diphosphoinositol-pentakisphosphate kinase n=1 Tax=Hucho hucho TaxID=62062 RepID=A0A4W5P9R1_9TELE
MYLVCKSCHTTCLSRGLLIFFLLEDSLFLLVADMLNYYHSRCIEQLLYGHFSGINRKVQLTYLPNGQPKASSEEEEGPKEGPSLLLVLKWGGELTPAGRVQAEELGRAFRCMYPGGQGDYAGFPGCGLLRLHSTYRHDLKIYASDEGRVQMTAAAFAKGLLALEGELTPILVQMVKSANMNGMLDSDSESLTDCQQRVKARLHEIMQKDQDFTEADYGKLAPTGSPSLVNSMKIIGNPVRTCDQVYALIQRLTSQIRKRLEDPKSADLQLYHSETLELMLQRWSKLERDFRNKSGRYDISKIPDIYDCVKYDTQHNSTLDLEDTLELFRLSRALADIVIPQEYGINKPEKMDIAQAYCLPLMKKIQLDLQRTHEDEAVNKLHPLYSRGVMSPGRHVRTRLYFTSESHVHSLLSIFRYVCLCAMDYLSAVSELNYMTQIVIMLYEDNNKVQERFHVELHFSPGVKSCEDEENVPLGFGFRPASAENQEKQTNQGSLEDLSQDEPDRALPLSELISIRRSPMIRNRKTGSMEVLDQGHISYCFEGCSMVPSIYPLETLHNSLSLKQVDEFLNAVCEDSSDAHAKTMKGRYSSQGRYLVLSRSNMPSLHTTDLIHGLFVLSHAIATDMLPFQQVSSSNVCPARAAPVNCKCCYCVVEMSRCNNVSATSW